MQSFIITTFIVCSGLAVAGQSAPVVEVVPGNENPHAHLASPLDHAPAGIMPDHIHNAGELMVGYHFMHMEMGGHRKGSEELTRSEVFELGYSGAAESMTMDMHMVELMYAPTDWLTLMLMSSYIYQDMEMTMMGGHGGHGGHAMAMNGTTRHSHATEG